MNDFVNRFVNVHRMPQLQAAARWARTRDAKAAGAGPAGEPFSKAAVPYQESIMILKHGTDHWRRWKASGDPICACCRRPGNG